MRTAQESQIPGVSGKDEGEEGCEVFGNPDSIQGSPLGHGHLHIFQSYHHIGGKGLKISKP